MEPVIPTSLLSTAYEVKTGQLYSRPLTADEAGALAEDISENEMKLDDLAEEMKAMREDFKLRKKELVGRRKALITQKKTGQIEETGSTYIMLDRDNKMAGIYNESGIRISQRRMRPEEAQYVLEESSSNRVISIAANDKP